MRSTGKDASMQHYRAVKEEEALHALIELNSLRG